MAPIRHSRQNHAGHNFNPVAYPSRVAQDVNLPFNPDAYLNSDHSSGSTFGGYGLTQSFSGSVQPSTNVFSGNSSWLPSAHFGPAKWFVNHNAQPSLSPYVHGSDPLLDRYGTSGLYGALDEPSVGSYGFINEPLHTRQVESSDAYLIAQGVPSSYDYNSGLFPQATHDGPVEPFSGHSIDPYLFADLVDDAFKDWLQGPCPSEGDSFTPPSSDSSSHAGPADLIFTSAPTSSASTPTSSTYGPTHDGGSIILPTVPPVPTVHAVEALSSSIALGSSSSVSPEISAVLCESNSLKPNGYKSRKGRDVKVKDSKQAPNPFIIFRAAVGREMKQDWLSSTPLLGPGGGKMKGPSRNEVSREASLRWNALTEEEKRPWKEEANELKKRGVSSN